MSSSKRSPFACLPLLLAVLAPVRQAHAETYNTCAGFIDSIPTVISTQGIWCLRKDLATNLTGVNAIDIQTNNVTIDCNGFKLGNLGAGAGTYSTGIYAYGQRSNITVRNCNIRGFRGGIMIYGNDPGSGHLVEDNIVDHSTANGIYVVGYSSIVRRNRVLDTGGAPGSDRASAITSMGDIIDNIVDGVSGAADVTNFAAYGLYAGGVGSSYQDGVLVRGNRIRNLIPKGTSEVVGIGIASTGALIRDNVLVEPVSATPGRGVYCSFGGILFDNVILNYATGNAYCTVSAGDAGGNMIY
jgi:hypothetical protein